MKNLLLLDAVAQQHSFGENLFVAILVLIFVGIPILVIIRKIKRKVRNLKDDIKDQGIGEAFMSRAEEWFDPKNKK
ncbi:MAG: hypothetical protein II865_01880 [Bacteroidales bacterium]|nr:hypothetical protein [Bacteroidales bacterium]